MTFWSIKTRLLSLVHRDEEGQGLAEYALILALIAVIAIVALIFMGSQISDKLSTIGSQLKSGSRHRDAMANPAYPTRPSDAT